MQTDAANPTLKCTILITRDALNDTVFEDISALFKQQHGRSFLPERSALSDFIQKGKIIAAMKNGHVVGVAMYKSIDWVDHSVGTIRHFVIGESEDTLSIGKQILACLMKNLFPKPDVVEFNGTLPHPDLQQEFIDHGFKKKDRPIFRLPINKRRMH